MGICPETNTKSPKEVTGEYGPIALGKPSGKILFTDIDLDNINIFGYANQHY